MRGIIQLLIVLLATLCAIGVAAAQSGGGLTLASGPTALIRGATTYSVAEGVRLQEGDILQTGPQSRVQFEVPDGPVRATPRGAVGEGGPFDGPGRWSCSLAWPRRSRAAG